MKMSLLTCISVGVAVKNKVRGEDTLEVAPIERIMTLDGEVNAEPTMVEISGEDKTATAYNITLKTSTALPCTWLPLFSSNRITSPDVKVGEQVMIYRYGDTDEYFWAPLGLHDDLRRLETVTEAYSATPDPDEALDPNTNMYTHTVSTHDKHITWKTSQANEEPFGYSLTLDTAYGKYEIVDNEGNVLRMDSKERIFKLWNTDETNIEINKKEIYAYSKDLVKIETDGERREHTKKETNVLREGATKIDATDQTHVHLAKMMQFGMDDACEPMMLGDKTAEFIREVLIPYIVNHGHIANNGVVTSPAETADALMPTAGILLPAVAKFSDGYKDGKIYSKVNKNQ